MCAYFKFSFFIRSKKVDGSSCRPRGESLGAQRLERGSKVDGTYISGHPSEKGPHHKRDHRMADSKQDDTLIVQRHLSIPFSNQLLSFHFRDETTSKDILFQR